MNPFASLLAAEHLDELLREAAAERRARLARGSNPSALRSALTWVLDRLPTMRAAVRSTTGPTTPVVGRAEA